MNLYIAALYTNKYGKGQDQFVKHNNEIEQEVFASIPNVLESYHYVGKQQYVDDMRAAGAKVFVDSGAFSAYTLGIDLSIEDYCAYLKRNEDIVRVEDGIFMASVLDGIGDPLLTYQNQLRMEELGVRPLPCFHAGEDERYLEWYIENYEYITLGGLVGASTDQLRMWLDSVWEKYLLDGAGNPKIKVHGFGMTSIPLMERYPWHSVDSSSWIQAASFGSVFTGDYGPISISEKSPARFDAGQHYDNMTQIEQDALRDYFIERGFLPERLRTVYQSRAAYNCLGYMEVNTRINEERQKHPLAQRLF